MTIKVKPMLAHTLDTTHSLIYPVWASPKYDGVRAIVMNGVVYSRKLLPIPNKVVQQRFGHLNGCDGELIVGVSTDKFVFYKSHAVVMSAEHPDEDDVHFYVYDRWSRQGKFDPDILPQEGKYIHRVEHVLIKNPTALDQYTIARLEEGYEGAMTRNILAPYKFGRSSSIDQHLIKWKKKGLKDSEAVVIGVREGTCISSTKTDRERTPDGHTKKVFRFADREYSGALGSLLCQDIHTGVKFQCGVGFTMEQRKQLWEEENLIGRMFTYTYQGTSKEKPRFPVFKGWRDPKDIS